MGKKKAVLVAILLLIITLFLTACQEALPNNLSPTALFTASPTGGEAPLKVTFDASDSADADGRIVDYSWDFGDGSSGSGETVTHTYQDAGDFSVELTITDDDGATDSLSLPFTVFEPQPGFGDGTYLVGVDIQPDTYRSTVDSTCYWARLNGLGGELDDIIVNGVHAPEIVTIYDTDKAFKTRGCGNWVPVESTFPATPATEFGDGTYTVGEHIAPGVYRANGTDDICYWARLSDFSQELEGIITNGIQPTVIEISSSDAGFTTFGCGTWSKQ